MKIKNLFKNRKLAITVASVVAIVGLSIGATFAYYVSVTPEIKNRFSIGSIDVDTELKENISGLKKEPYVKNTGEDDCLVRIRVTVSPSDVGISLDYQDTWKQVEEFYYYQGVLEPEATTSNLFTTVDLPDEWDKEDGSIDAEKFVQFDIGLYQEAVQATLYNYYDNGDSLSAYTVLEDGTKVFNEENAAKIWKYYDSLNK